MNYFLMMCLLFFIGSTLGWIMEFFFRRFFSPEKRWLNPGFLTGPWLPIYGFGLCTLFLLASTEKYIGIENPISRKVLLFFLMAVCMTLIEYIAGLIFVKGLKTKLWDYSEEKFNIQGIICLRFSVIWAFLGAVYYFLFNPLIMNVIKWFEVNIQFSFILGTVFGIFAIDVVYSFNVVAKIRAFAKENDILIRYEELKADIRKTVKEQKKKYKFMFPFRQDVPLREHLVKYLELVRAFESKGKK